MSAIRRTGCWRAARRYRLPAEMVRDQCPMAGSERAFWSTRSAALVSSPYQPKGLWEENRVRATCVLRAKPTRPATVAISIAAAMYSVLETHQPRRPR